MVPQYPRIDTDDPGLLGKAEHVPRSRMGKWFTHVIIESWGFEAPAEPRGQAWGASTPGRP